MAGIAGFGTATGLMGTGGREDRTGSGGAASAAPPPSVHSRRTTQHTSSNANAETQRAYEAHVENMARLYFSSEKTSLKEKVQRLYPTLNGRIKVARHVVLT